jgi:hypothetical protein
MNFLLILSVLALGWIIFALKNQFQIAVAIEILGYIRLWRRAAGRKTPS